jgi:hypothetical protein
MSFSCFSIFYEFFMVFPQQKPSKSDVFPMEHQAFSVALPGRQPCGEAELSLRRDAAAVSGPTPQMGHRWSKPYQDGSMWGPPVLSWL